MSELFANLGGFRKPDVRMNQGPLPSVGGGPVGSDGTPDGVINGTGSLLENITPYAYGESARAGSDSNYQQIPHRAQYIVLPLHLPTQDGTSLVKISHAVDNGEMAFVLMTRGRQWFSPGENVAVAGPISLPLFCNVATVNYILACMQLAPPLAAAGQKRSWTAIRKHLWRQGQGGFEVSKTKENGADRVQHLFEMVQYTVQHLFKPHGVCAGSEKQGGQHEESWAPVQAAVNYTTTMTVDGQNRDLMNYWHSLHICAGDRLLLRLELVNEGSAAGHTQEHLLTSYYKRPVSATVVSSMPYWRLAPHILHADASACTDGFDYRVTGYWHIAQSFQGRRGFDTSAAQHAGPPLHVTFAPVFVKTGSGGQQTAYFLQELFTELLPEKAPQLLEWCDTVKQRSGCNPDDIKFLFKQMGAKKETIKRLFDSHGDFVVDILTRDILAYSTENIFTILWMTYRFALKNKAAGTQRLVLSCTHNVKLRELLLKQPLVPKKDINDHVVEMLKKGMLAGEWERLRKYVADLTGRHPIVEVVGGSGMSAADSRTGQGIFPHGLPDGVFSDRPSNVVASADEAFRLAAMAGTGGDESTDAARPKAKVAKKRSTMLQAVAE